MQNLEAFGAILLTAAAVAAPSW